MAVHLLRLICAFFLPALTILLILLTFILPSVESVGGVNKSAVFLGASVTLAYLVSLTTVGYLLVPMRTALLMHSLLKAAFVYSCLAWIAPASRYRKGLLVYALLSATTFVASFVAAPAYFFEVYRVFYYSVPILGAVGLGLTWRKGAAAALKIPAVTALLAFVVFTAIDCWMLYSGMGGFLSSAIAIALFGSALYSHFKTQRETLRERSLVALKLERELAVARTHSITASQAAHDIRSPLLALNVVSEQGETLSDDARRLLKAAVGRIDAIARGLTSDAGSEVRRFRLVDAVREVLAEKRTLYRSRPDVRIGEELGDGFDGFVDGLARDEFQRTLSNLVDNAVEAIESGGNVIVTLRGDASSFVLHVSDDGRGIPEGVLPRLGTRGLSLGKPGGHGLGLHAAKAFARSAGGELVLRSIVGTGTRVTLTLPRQA